MITVENSSIVNWDNYPEFVCALVVQTTKDLETTAGTICPKGEELIWLLDKPPTLVDGVYVMDNVNINFLGGIGVDSNYGGIPMKLLELHFKPKPVVKIELKQECFA